MLTLASSLCCICSLGYLTYTYTLTATPTVLSWARRAIYVYNHLLDVPQTPQSKYVQNWTHHPLTLNLLLILFLWMMTTIDYARNLIITEYLPSPHHLYPPNHQESRISRIFALLTIIHMWITSSISRLSLQHSMIHPAVRASSPEPKSNDVPSSRKPSLTTPASHKCISCMPWCSQIPWANYDRTAHPTSSCSFIYEYCTHDCKLQDRRCILFTVESPVLSTVLWHIADTQEMLVTS